jgi:SAM-dependent methyltransferase
MRRVDSHFLDKSFWLAENTRYAEPSVRLVKCAAIVNRLARGRPVELLDIGCGPASLANLLDPNVAYHGIDIALHEHAPNFLERDLAASPISFHERTFDIVVAAGFLEYMGTHVRRKLNEIGATLKQDGVFVATYTNFGHIHRRDYHPYNYVLSLRDFRRDLEERFVVRRTFPSSYNWQLSEPRRRSVKAMNRLLNANIPLLNRLLAVNYFFICSPRLAHTEEPSNGSATPGQGYVPSDRS